MVKQDAVFVGLPPVFRQVATTEAGRFLAETAQLVSLKKGEPFERDFSLQGYFAISKSGFTFRRVLSPMSSSGSLIVAIYQPGDLISVPPAQQVEVFGLEPSTLMAVWSYKDYLLAMKKSPALAEWTLNFEAKWLGWTTAEKLHFAVYSLQVRLAHLYWSLAETLADGRRVLTLKIPQNLLAEILQTTREEISRKKSTLEKAGYIHTTNEGLELDPTVPNLFILRADSMIMQRQRPIRFVA